MLKNKYLLINTPSNSKTNILPWLGIGGNSMSIIVLSRPKIRETSFNQLLLVVCIVDTVFILCNIPSCLTALGIKNGKNIFKLLYQIHLELHLNHLGFFCSLLQKFTKLDGRLWTSINVCLSFDDCSLNFWTSFCH